MFFNKILSHDSKKIEYVFLALVAIWAAFLLFWNLDNQYLWQDEAQTALIGKTILTYGIPKCYDGINSFSQEIGAECGKNYIWKWHTWLQFYIAAISFKLFGVNTFTARLPFALFGFGTVFVTYYFAKYLFKEKRIAVLAVLLLLISVPFLILSKQCRYYSPSMFFSLLSLYGYLKIIRKEKYGIILYVLSMTLLFHAHFIYAGIVFIAVFIHALLCHRSALKRVLVPSIAVLFLNMPWIVWQSSMEYGERYSTDMLDFNRIIRFWKLYTLDLFKHIISPFILLIPLFVSGFQWYKKKPFISKDQVMWKNILLLMLFVIINLAVLSMVSPAPFFRYLTPLIPVIIIIAALIISSFKKFSWIAGIAILMILAGTGSFRDYIYEITHDYDGPIEGITGYLNENGNNNDTVIISYGDLPLKFYTEMRILGGLTGENLSVAKDAEWIILRKHIISDDRKVTKYVLENIDLLNYNKIVIDYPDIPFENREEPDEHNFRTVTGEDRVIIFQRHKTQ